MHHRPCPPVEAAGVAGPRVGQAQLPARIGEADLAVVHVPGEDELEGSGWQPVDRRGEVGEEDGEVGRPPQVGLPAPGAGVEAGDPHPASPQVEEAPLVEEERGRRQALQLHGLREGIAARRQVVVAEDGVAGREAADEVAEEGLAPPSGDEVAGQGHEIRAAGGRPGHGPAHRPLPPRGQAQVEVGQVGDAEPVQLWRQARHLHLQHAEPYPPRLDPAPEERGPGHGAGGSGGGESGAQT